jgi:hypothetical protein
MRPGQFKTDALTIGTEVTDLRKHPPQPSPLERYTGSLLPSVWLSTSIVEYDVYVLTDVRQAEPFRMACDDVTARSLWGGRVFRFVVDTRGINPDRLRADRAHVEVQAPEPFPEGAKTEGRARDTYQSSCWVPDVAY